MKIHISKNTFLIGIHIPDNLYFIMNRKKCYFVIEENDKSFISTAIWLIGSTYIKANILRGILHRRICYDTMDVPVLKYRKDRIIACVSILRMITNDRVKSGGVVI